MSQRAHEWNQVRNEEYLRRGISGGRSELLRNPSHTFHDIVLNLCHPLLSYRVSKVEQQSTLQSITPHNDDATFFSFRFLLSITLSILPTWATTTNTLAKIMNFWGWMILSWRSSQRIHPANGMMDFGAGEQSLCLVMYEWFHDFST